MPRKSPISWPAFIVGLLLAAVVMTLFVVVACGPFAATSTPAPPAEVPQEFDILWEVWQVLNNEYVGKDNLDAEALSEGAIRGMLGALGDPYTSYLAKGHYQMALHDLEGNFEGIGAEVGLRDGRLTILAPLPDTPAERAGIRSGDVILAVDGQSIETLSLIEAVLLIRGPKGTPVELLIQRRGAERPESFTIVRGTIHLDSVHLKMLEGDIAYIRISSFTENTSTSLVETLKEARSRGARALVLDLRNNPGGLLEATVKVASQFLKEGLVLYEVDGKGERTDWPVRPGGAAQDLPMVVLVNEFSASGSEVLTGALMAHGRATVIGNRTFGKGSVNILRQLSDSSALYLTIARWYTPDDVLIEGEGLEPDLLVEQPQESPEDVQLQRALELLRQEALAAAG